MPVQAGNLMLPLGVIVRLNASDKEKPRMTQPKNQADETPTIAAKRKIISSAPMGSAPFKYTGDGQVAWDEMWADFCDLALEGGPAHRGDLLEPVSPDAVSVDPAAYRRVVDEIARGLSMITGLQVLPDERPGWVGLVCTSKQMARWMRRAILAENVTVNTDGAVLYLPAGADYRLEYEIKNVVTVVAKTHHYWTAHLMG